MTHQVQFPNLGISVEVNPIAFQVGNFTIYWYGIIIGIGFLLAVLYGFSSCKKMNINKDHLLDAIIAGLLGGIIGARLYYVIFYPGDKYITNPMEIFNIKEGGLGIYGGIIGGLLCGGIVAKIRKMNLFAVLDVASLGYLIGQGVGRWGNFVNQEAFGCATDLPWGMYSDRTAAEVVGNVHPCFLYESILCLLGFVLLHLFTRHLRRYDGQTFLLYIIWYGVTRFFIEGLRTDSLLACRLGLFAARHRVQYIPFLVNHAQFQCLFAGRYNGETRFGAAEYGPFDGLHLAGERTGRIGDIVDVAACHAYVLEVVDVPADVHIHLVLAQDGIETCLHIRAFALVLRGFGIDGMVSGNDNPVLFGGSQYGIYPGKLLLVILLAGIGIGLAVVAVFVNHRGGVYPKDADGSAVVLERLGIITGGHRSEEHTSELQSH